MSAPLVSAEVTYDPADYLAFARRIAAWRLAYYRAGALVLCGLMVLTLVLDWGLNQPLPLWQVGLGFIGAAALWFLSTGRLQARAVGRHARKIGAANPQVFKIAEEGFEAKGPSETSVTKWSDIPEMDLVDDRLFVVVAGNKAFIVPRRAFSSDAAFGDFVGAAKVHWAVHHRL